MENKDRMFTGDLYLPNDAAITEEQNACLELLYTIQPDSPSEQEKRNQLLKYRCSQKYGETSYIEPPFLCKFRLERHVHFGKNIYANFNLTMVDDGHIYVGDYTMFAPSVIVATAGHPILPELRETVYQYNMPVHIGKNCWIGAGAIIFAGCYHWRPSRCWCRQCCHERLAVQRGSSWKSLPSGSRSQRT